MKKSLCRALSIILAAILLLGLALPTVVLADQYTIGVSKHYNATTQVTIEKGGWYFIEAWGGNGGDGAGDNGGSGGVSQRESGYFYFEAGDVITVQVGAAGGRGGSASGGTGGASGSAGTALSSSDTFFGAGYPGGSGGNVTRSGIGIVGGAGYGGGGGGSASGVLLNGTAVSNLILASGGGGGGGGEGGNNSIGQRGGNGGASNAYGVSDSQSGSFGNAHSITDTNGYNGNWIRHNGEDIHVSAGIGYGGGGAGGGGGGWNGMEGGGGKSGAGGNNGLTAAGTEGGGGAAGGQSGNAGISLPSYITHSASPSVRSNGVNGQVWITYLGDKYTVSYVDDQADSGNVPVDTTYYEPDAQVTVKGNEGTPPLVKEGYRFVGWVDQDGTFYAPGSVFSITKNMEMRAVWKLLLYVTYQAGSATGGTVPIDSNAYIENDLVTVRDKGTLVKSGYRFAYWKDQDGGEWDGGDTFHIVKSMTLTAIWELNPADAYWLHVTYADGGATGGSVPTDSTLYEPDDRVTVLGNPGVLYKTNHTFGGWTDGDTIYQAGEQFTITANTTLTAVWTKDQPVGGSLLLNKSKLTLRVGQTEQLLVTELPSGVLLGDLRWTSSDDNFATVDQNGHVTAIKAGVVTVTVATLDGAHSAECVVTILSDIPPTGDSGDRVFLLLLLVNAALVISVILLRMKNVLRSKSR